MRPKCAPMLAIPIVAQVECINKRFQLLFGVLMEAQAAAPFFGYS
jgi:hypothetical protein